MEMMLAKMLVMMMGLTSGAGPWSASWSVSWSASWPAPWPASLASLKMMMPAASASGWGGRVGREFLMMSGDFSAAGSCPAGSCPALDVEGDGLAREGLGVGALAGVLAGEDVAALVSVAVG
jgi:hypothetical protein